MVTIVLQGRGQPSRIDDIGQVFVRVIIEIGNLAVRILHLRHERVGRVAHRISAAIVINHLLESIYIGANTGNLIIKPCSVATFFVPVYC